MATRPERSWFSKRMEGVSAEDDDVIEGEIVGEGTEPHLEVVATPEASLYENLTEKGNERLERAKSAVSGTISKVGGFFQKTWGKVKGLSSEALKVVLSAPEIVRFGKDKIVDTAVSAKEAVTDKATAMKDVGVEAYRGTVNKIGSTIEKGGVMLKGAKERVVNGAKEKYSALEARTIGAYENMKGRIDAATERAKARAAAKEVAEQIAKYQYHREEMEKLEAKFREIGFVKAV